MKELNRINTSKVIFSLSLIFSINSAFSALPIINITKNEVVTRSLTDKDISDIKLKKGEDYFYTQADQNAAYFSKIIDLSDKNDIGIQHLKEDSEIVFGNQFRLKSRSIPPWYAVIYLNGLAPKLVAYPDIINIISEFSLVKNEPAFVPDTMYVYQSKEADFNNDGVIDKILVLKNVSKQNIPNSDNFGVVIRILKGLGKGKFTLWASNESYLRSGASGPRCASNGFEEIVTKKEYVTIETQFCDDHRIAYAYPTFKYDKNSDQFLLSSDNREQVNVSGKVVKTSHCSISAHTRLEEYTGRCDIR